MPVPREAGDRAGYNPPVEQIVIAQPAIGTGYPYNFLKQSAKNVVIDPIEDIG